MHIVEFKAHEKNLEILVSYDNNISSYLHGDSLRLSQILTNLLSNAIKFTDNGEICIYVQKTSENRYRFEIKDTGIGLTAEQQNRLFTSFAQADNSVTRKYGGTGLGLSISKQLVELMDGKIWIESEFGKGSSFIFEVSLKEQKWEFNNYTSFTNKKVLIVEDNKNCHQILKNLLNKFDIEVEVAHNGYNAIEIINNNCQKYDLILMDWNMPKLNGIETTKIINENCHKNKPPTVIMVSAFRQDSVVNLAKDVGIDIFLQKPINPSTLNDILNGIFKEEIQDKYTNILEHKINKNKISGLYGSHILLVEDNEINKEIIMGLLEDSGIKIDVASNGVEAIEKFKSKRSYEAILMDIQMPIMDGISATKIIRTIDTKVPIIALTANAMHEDILKTKKAGMNAHLNKPIDIDKLYKTLLKYISIKSKVKTNSESTNIQNIPVFESLDINIGLKYLANNKKLYLKILNNFLQDYKNISYLDIENDFVKIVHTIKGLSLNIGASKLHQLSIKLEKNSKFLHDFYEELKNVTYELGEKLTKTTTNKISKNKISKSSADKLFLSLKEAIKTQQPKKCLPILEEINSYELIQDDQQLYEIINSLIQRYDFKKAEKILNER